VHNWKENSRDKFEVLFDLSTAINTKVGFGRREDIRDERNKRRKFS